jgi:hypothetical protein
MADLQQICPGGRISEWGPSLQLGLALALDLPELVERNGARAKDAKEIAMLIELDDPEIEDLAQCLADAAVQAELAELVELAWRNVAEAQALGLIRITWAEDGTILGIELADVVLH